MYLPKSCFAGRILIRREPVNGVDWLRTCPVPPEMALPLDPPMYFCVRHFNSAVHMFYPVLDELGLIDHGVVQGPMDDFDEIMRNLRSGKQ